PVPADGAGLRSRGAAARDHPLPDGDLVLAARLAPSLREGDLMAAPGATAGEVTGAEAHADYARAARRSRVFGTGKGIAAYLVLTVFALIAIVPFIYMLSPSLRQSYELFTYPPQWIPNHLYWGNFGTVLHKTSYLHWVVNTLIFATSVTLITLAID